MHDIDLRNIQTFQAAVLIKELAAKGLEHVVISPGSRSTPLTLACAVHPTIKSHIVIDERSAAFIALGIAKASEKPAALVCTSGTAVANYFPAVAEAQRSGIPMIVLSADRDFNEMNTGANQWIDQVNIFGNKAVFFAQINPRDNDQRDTTRLTYLAHQAWTEATQKGGCAHLNIPFRKPLEPTDEFLNNLTSFYQHESQSDYQISHPDATLNLDSLIRKRIRESTNPVIIATGGTTSSTSIQLTKHLSKAGIPILAEAGAFGSELGSFDSLIDGSNSFLRSPETCKELSPDLIIRFGEEPIGKGILTFIKTHQDVPTIRFAERLAWSNSSFNPESLVLLPSSCTIELSESLDVAVTPEWLGAWRKFESVVLHTKESIKVEATTLRDGDIYLQLSEHLSENDVLFVSNSFPARDIDSFGNKRLKSRKIYMNRGASGIDGIISTAIGVSMVSSDPLTLITGDLAFAHDLSALITLKNLRSSLRIIVINNNGGGIFDMLPIADSNHFDTYFRTSQHIDAQAIAVAAGLQSIKVSSVVELKRALQSDQVPLVIECITDQNASMNQRRALWG
jgi:2-succinyl-5-enolpyruvyl-6-hydroxy-3-cyclohexene-1-carboxylate synthase